MAGQTNLARLRQEVRVKQTLAMGLLPIARAALSRSKTARFGPTPRPCRYTNVREIGTTITNWHRSRNYAMNTYMNGTPTIYAGGVMVGDGDGDPPKLTFFQKETQLLTPASLFVFIDQDPFSIDDDEFSINPFDPGSDGLTGMEAPSRVHGNCFNWSFGDGHAETYKLRSSRSINWFGETGGSYTVTRADPAWPNGLNPDWLMVSNHTSVFTIGGL